MALTLWHNPRCSKSRQAVALLSERGITYQTRLYLDDAPSLAELQDVQSKLGCAALEMMRPKDAVFKEMGLTRDMADADLLGAMATQPRLIERPILISDSRAVIGRPTECLLDLL